MLSLLSAAKKPASTLAEVLPWIDLVSDGLMLCKDGSLLASFEYGGLDFDNIQEDVLGGAMDQLLRSYAALDERITMWWSVSKKRDTSYPQNPFVNQAAQALDDLVEKHFDDGEVYCFTYHLHMLFTGETGVFRYMDSVARMVNEDGMSYPAALLKATMPGQAVANAALYDQKQLGQNIEEFERIIVGFVGATPFLGLNRLYESDLVTVLFREANIAFPTNTQFRKPEGSLFDSWASQSEIDSGRKSVRVSSAFGDRHLAQLRVMEYPPQVGPMMLESTLAIASEMKLTLCVRFLGQAKSRAAIDGVADYYKMTQFSLLGRALKALTRKEAAADQGKLDLLAATLDAKRQQMSRQLPFVYMSLALTVIADSSSKLEQSTNLVVSRLADSGCSVGREFLGCLPAYFSTIPGQYAYNVRLQGPINGEVLTMMTPVFTVHSGNPLHPYFSEILDHPVPAFSVFKNRYGGTVNFSPHFGQIGHMLIVAPTGGGKTTFANFALSQFQRYSTPEKPVRTIVFDRDRSCRITTLLHDGTHIDMKSGSMKLNPVGVILEQTEDSRVWVREYIIRRIEEGNDVVTAVMRNQLDEAILVLQKRAEESPNIVPTLSDVRGQLHGNMRSLLTEWCDGGAYANFDSASDDLDLADWTCIEMKEIMASERLARAFIDHVFRRILKSLDGTITFIYLEEASFLLRSPAFLPVIEDWIKTIRKLGGFLWMTVQSPESIPDGPAGKSILDNIFSYLFLANTRAESHRDYYKRLFALTDEQVDDIKTLTPQREYMLVTNGTSRVMKMVLDKQSLAYLRSEIKLQNRFDEVAGSGTADWKQRYLDYAKGL